MKKNKRGNRLVHRIGRILISLVLALSLAFPTFTQEVFAGEKVQKTHDIAIVFDNSGSMYGFGSFVVDDTAWCRAIYSVEVFASLANEGDNIWVYPMNEATINGKTYDMNTPLKITGGGDVTAIRNLITPDVENYTPIESIQKAEAGLATMPGDEKWLVVLTDGVIFHKKDDSGEYKGLTKEQTKSELTNALSEANQKFNVMYLGIGSKAADPTIKGKANMINEVKIAKDSADVLNYLTAMSNTIFGRDELKVEKNKVSFDLTMKKLIVVVQGKGISGLKLKNSGGEEAGKKTSEYSPRYSEQACGKDAKVDESLSGMIVTYDDLEPGTYELSYSGDAASIGVYYEPDVSLAAYLTDDQGGLVSDYSMVYPGTYQLHYGLVDKSGKTVDSPLLGDKNFKVTYQLDGETKTASSKENAYCDIELKQGSKLDAEIDATYLSGYTDHATSDLFGWPAGGIICVERPAGSFEVRVSGGESSYPANQLEEKGVYNVTLWYDGEQVTGADLERVKLEPIFADDKALGSDYQISETQDGMLFSLKHPGEPFETPTGDYVMNIAASYKDEHDVTATAASAEIPFEITEVRDELEVVLEHASTYTTVADAKKGDPVVAHITKNGQPLTKEEMDALVLDVDGSGLTCETELDYDNSAVKVYIKADENLKVGKYDFTVAATALDSVGREITDSDSTVLQYGNIPRWLKLLILGIIAALIILLIALIMNQKILPKDIRAGNTKFTLDGDEVTGKAHTEFPGKKKKTSSLTIISPKCAANPTAKCGVILQLVADSPRRTKSSQRKAIVTSVSPIGGQQIQNLQIAGTSFVKDEETGKLKPARGKNTKMDQLNIRLSNGSRISITGEVMDPDGGMSDIALNVTLKYF